MTIDSPVFFPKRGSVNKKGPPAFKHCQKWPKMGM